MGRFVIRHFYKYTCLPSHWLSVVVELHNHCYLEGYTLQRQALLYTIPCLTVLSEGVLSKGVLSGGGFVRAPSSTLTVGGKSSSLSGPS